MSTKHTPGPWFHEFHEFCPISPYGQFVIKAGEKGLPVAMLPMPLGGINTREKQLANARLIAAAPDLLDACRDALEFIEKHTEGIVIDAKDTLRIAIKKAEGEQ